jgi:hypothetical protein
MSTRAKLPAEYADMFQVFDALFDADQWSAALEYAQDLAADYASDVHIYRDSVLVAIVKGATRH